MAALNDLSAATTQHTRALRTPPAEAIFVAADTSLVENSSRSGHHSFSTGRHFLKTIVFWLPSCAALFVEIGRRMRLMVPWNRCDGT
jgi:hypothetical protein